MQLHYNHAEAQSINERLGMDKPLFVSESTLTDRYQTTVPDTVRKALRLSKREKIRYTIQSDGNVLLSRADQDKSDPALDSFLTFLANDIQNNPQHLKVVTSTLLNNIQDLVGEMDVDLDIPLDDKDE